MAYATETDCRLHAPQAVAGDDFSGNIAQADAVVDSRLRGSFTVPFDDAPDCPKLITNIVSRLAAGRYLEAHYSKINAEPPEYAADLISGAMKELDEIVADPSILGIDLRPITPEDLERDAVKVSDRDNSVFDSSDPRDW